LFLWNLDLIFHSRQFGNDPKPFDGPELDFQIIIAYQDLEEHSEDLPLLDPSSSNTTVGSITISCYIEVMLLLVYFMMIRTQGASSKY
jgi:hypothetical protein